MIRRLILLLLIVAISDIVFAEENGVESFDDLEIKIYYLPIEKESIIALSNDSLKRSYKLYLHIKKVDRLLENKIVAILNSDFKVSEYRFTNPRILIKVLNHDSLLKQIAINVMGVDMIIGDVHYQLDKKIVELLESTLSHNIYKEFLEKLTFFRSKEIDLKDYSEYEINIEGDINLNSPDIGDGTTFE